MENVSPNKIDNLPGSFTDWFLSYVDGFITGEPERDANILLKREHSLEVLDNARHILPTLGWDKDQRLIGAAAALLHDVGRFDQLARFNTFRDALSIDHALAGTRVLSRQPLLESLPGRGRKVVLGAVFLHNKPGIPDDLPGDLDQVTRLVRDADKIDILRIIGAEVLPGGGGDATVLMNLAHDSERFTPGILDRVRQRRPVDYGKLVYVNDFVILVSGWVYNMNFSGSFRRLLETGRLQSLLGVLPDVTVLKEFEAEVMDWTAERAATADVA